MRKRQFSTSENEQFLKSENCSHVKNHVLHVWKITWKFVQNMHEKHMKITWKIKQASMKNCIFSHVKNYGRFAYRFIFTKEKIILSIKCDHVHKYIKPRERLFSWFSNKKLWKKSQQASYALTNGEAGDQCMIRTARKT